MIANKTIDKVIKEIIKEVKKKKIKNKKEAGRIKRRICKKYNIKGVVSDTEIFAVSGLPVFSRKPSRALSGVSVVAVMTSPAHCPHGKCVFCPGGVEYMTPQSYTGEEPAALRAKMADYDAYKQVKNRLKQYYLIGQTPSKVELIIMGGTFTSRSWKYQKEFITDCFKALNNKKESGLKRVQLTNETAKHRCVGLTIETRPDEINTKTINRMLELGATRVELGVQTVYDSVLKKSERGHTVKDVIKATKLLKDAGFKINYHLMTNMPGSDLKKDFKSFKKIFNHERFKPDMIKLYPTLLIKGTKLYELYKAMKWKPYTLKETVNLIARVKKFVPSHVRIMRIQRDIPSFLIESELKKSNLRQLVQKEMKNRDWVCKCIRCREAGRNKGVFKKARVKTKRYTASKGVEYFIEFTDDKNVLFGFIRARIPSKSKTLLVRELHVYGEQVPIGGKGSVQHRGIGKALLGRVEELAVKKGLKKVKVISGVGVRGYYKRLGYERDGFYMSKFIY
jgi:elongator complex protein 3